MSVLELTREDITEGPLLRALLVLAAPLLVQQLARQSIRVVVVVVFAAAGGAGLAAYLIGARVAAVASVPAIGL